MILLRFLILAAAVALVAWLVVRATRPPEVCRLEIRGRRAELRGSLPLRSRADIVEFFEDLDLPEGAVVCARAAGRSMRIGFNAAVPEHLHQRIRNFLMLSP